MLTTKPTLSINSPSPTTIEYTVTTIPPPTLTNRLLFTLVAILRISLGTSILLLLYSIFRLSSYGSTLTFTHDPDFLSTDAIWWALETMHASAFGTLLQHLINETHIFLLLPTSLFILSLLLKPLHTTESLLVLRGLGIQTKSSRTSYLSTDSTRFIPTSEVQDILVNEIFRGFEVRYTLNVVVDGEEEVVVVFPGLLPARKVVEKVWRGARKCLWGEEVVFSQRKGKDVLGGVQVVRGEREKQVAAE